MAIVANPQAAVPTGKHRGLMTALETTKVFDARKGPENVVEFTIFPKWRQDEETETLPVSFTVSPVLNNLSGLSKLLARLGITPKKGETWDAKSLQLEVEFEARAKPDGFIEVVKDSVRKVG